MMQRIKVQGSTVANGPKDLIKEDEFDSWRNRPHQAYNTPMSTSSINEYLPPSYYASMSFPYLNQGLGDGGAWSNGSDPMTFLGGHSMGGGDSHYMDGMFGQNSFSGYSQGFSYFPGTSGDYSTWGNSAMSAHKPGGHTAYHDDYYRSSYDQGADRGALKHVEQTMGNLTLSDHKNDSHFNKDGYSKPVVVPGASSLMSDHQLGKKFGISHPDSVSLTATGQPVGSKKMTWASIASQPAKPQPKAKKSFPPAPMLHGKHGSPGMDIGTWENKNGSSGGTGPGGGKMGPPPPPPQSRSSAWGAPRGNRANGPSGTGYSAPNNQPQPSHVSNQLPTTDGYPSHPVLDKLRMENNYNPKEFDLNPKSARYFIIKSYSEDDIHRSIKYSIWCSTEHGNKRLDNAYREREGKGPLYLFFSVNGSGHFCGMAQMVSPVDYDTLSGVWAQDKWKGQFKVKWIYVKDVPNSQLRHIRLENNENKPVTNSRDTQEVPPEKGKEVLKIIHNFQHVTSIFDDFLHYEKRQEEDEHRKNQLPVASLEGGMEELDGGFQGLQKSDTTTVARLQDHITSKGKEARPVILKRSTEYQ